MKWPTLSVWHIVIAHGVAVPIEGITSEGFLRFPIGKLRLSFNKYLTPKIQPKMIPLKTFTQGISVINLIEAL